MAAVFTRVRRSGTCTNVPYSDEIPPDSNIRTWPLRERNGLLFAWYHAEGKEPDWEISKLPQFSGPEMRIAGYRCTHFTGHIQDVLENGVDLPHYLRLSQGHPGRGLRGGDRGIEL